MNPTACRRINIKYLFTIEKLEEHAIRELPSMDRYTYHTFEFRMQQIARENGIAQPVLALGIKYKKDVGSPVDELVCTVTCDQWLEFAHNARLYDGFPRVFVLNYSKFRLPARPLIQSD